MTIKRVYKKDCLMNGYFECNKKGVDNGKSWKFCFAKGTHTTTDKKLLRMIRGGEMFTLSRNFLVKFVFTNVCCCCSLHCA